MGRAIPTNPSDQFVAGIEERLRQLQKPRPFVIPVYQDDPLETDATNLWMRADGRLRGRYWNGTVFVYVDYPMRSDISGPPAVPAAPPVPAKPPAAKTYRTSWTATWSQSYLGNDSKRLDSLGETMLVFGDDTGGNGLQKSLLGFNGAAIVAALAGSTLKRIQLTITNLGSLWESGVDIYLGVHNESAEPLTWDVASLPVRRVSRHHFGRPETRTVDLPLDFAQRFRAGTGKGLAFEAPTANRDFYGYAAGVGTSYPTPQITITYAK